MNNEIRKQAEALTARILAAKRAKEAEEKKAEEKRRWFSGTAAYTAYRSFWQALEKLGLSPEVTGLQVVYSDGQVGPNEDEMCIAIVRKGTSGLMRPRDQDGRGLVLRFGILPYWDDATGTGSWGITHDGDRIDAPAALALTLDVIERELFGKK